MLEKNNLELGFDKEEEFIHIAKWKIKFISICFYIIVIIAIIGYANMLMNITHSTTIVYLINLFTFIICTGFWQIQIAEYKNEILYYKRQAQYYESIIKNNETYIYPHTKEELYNYMHKQNKTTADKV